MIVALLLAMIVAHRGRILDALIGIGAAIAFFGTLPLLGLEAWAPVWSLVLVGAVVVIQLRHGTNGRDARFEAEERDR